MKKIAFWLCVIFLLVRIDSLATGVAQKGQRVDVTIQDNGLPYDERKASAIAQRIAELPQDIHATLIERGFRIVLINGAVTDYPLFSHLKEQVPRGWEETGKTWDAVPGITWGNTAVIRLSSLPSGTVDVALHEVGHLVDRAYGIIPLSETPQFRALWQKEAPLTQNPYFIAYADEFFAEQFANYFYSEKTRRALANELPNTFAYFALKWKK